VSGLKDCEQYCPICARVIVAENAEEVESGEHDGYLFVHDDIVHGDDDIDALANRVQ
jgi:hypothetical protein